MGEHMALPAIALEQVGLEIGALRILRDIDLNVEQGEVVSVIGPSGCGKTTLLNVIAGLAPTWTGRASTLGGPITGPGPDRTVVFQEDAVFPWMTVRKNVGYALALRKTARDEANAVINEMIELVGLAGKENLYPRQLSGGQRKRVDLARALAARPSVLLMDEPYAALDQMTKQRLQQEFLNAVQRENMTSVFVTHDLEESIFVADRIVIMAADPGRIVEVVPVPFPHPRLPDLRMAEKFQAIRKHISNAIHASETVIS
jgi:NitT/TauT family transport system ATP-binding protein